MRKKILTVLTSVMMMGLCLSGCGKKNSVTADDLLKEPFKTQVTSLDADINIEASASINLDSFMGAEADSSKMMDVSGSVKGSIKNCNNISYFEGDISYDLFGMSDTTQCKTYAEKREDGKNVIYSYDSYDETWNVSISENEEINTDIFKKQITSDIFDSYELKEEDGYEITGIVSIGKIMEFADDMATNTDALDETIEQLEENETLKDVDYKNIRFEVVLKYDKEKILKNISIKYDSDIEIPSVEIKQIEIVITINSINETEIKIPEEAVKEAEEYEKMLEDMETEEVEVTTEDTESQVFDIGDDASENLATLVYGKQTVTSDDIIATISGTYMEMPSDSVINAMVNILNTNTLQKFRTNLVSYNTWNEDNKQAIVYFYGLGVFTLEDLAVYGVDVEMVKESYNEIHQIPTETE